MSFFINRPFNFPGRAIKKSASVCAGLAVNLKPSVVA